MPFMSVNSYVGLGIEATRGTVSSNIKFIPVTSPQVTPQQTWLRDEAYRGSAVTIYDNVLGVRHDEYDFKGFVFADTIGILAKAALGYEAVTGSGTYTHSFALKNDVTGSQPPAVSIQDFDGANPFQILAAQLGDLKFTFGAEAALEYEAKLMGNPFTVIAAPTKSFSSEAFIPGWDLALTIGGTSSSVVVDGEINITRGTAPIFTAAGSTSPYRNFAGPIDVTGRMKFVVESNDPILYNGSGNGFGLVDSPQAVVLTFTDPTSTHTITMTMSKVQFFNPKRDRSKAYVEVDAEFVALANATDAVAGAGAGYSPISIVATNSVSAVY